MIRAKYRLNNMSVVPDVIKLTTKRLGLYPIIIFICWLLNTSTVLYAKINPSASGSTFNFLLDFGTFLSILQGFLFSIVFFMMNPIVLLKWKCLILSLCGYNIRNLSDEPAVNNPVFNAENRKSSIINEEITFNEDEATAISESSNAAFNRKISRSSLEVSDEVDYIPTNSRFSSFIRPWSSRSNWINDNDKSNDFTSEENL